MWRKCIGVVVGILLVGIGYTTAPDADIAPSRVPVTKISKPATPPYKSVTKAPVQVGPLTVKKVAPHKFTPRYVRQGAVLQAEDTLRYDDPNTAGSNAIGLTNGGTYQAAIRLTPTELGPYNGNTLIAVSFFHYEVGTHSGRIIIYGGGTPTEPGDTLTTEPYTVTGQGFFRVDLSSPVIIDASQDMWVSVQITHNAGEYPVGVDVGPAVDGKGDWVYSSSASIPWSELQDFGLDYNWDILAIVHLGPPPDHDVAASQILAPTGTVPANEPVTPTARFSNIGLNTETFDAFFEIYDNANNLVYSDQVTGVTLDSAQSIDLSFTDWTPTVGGLYTAVAYHNLSDENPTNDTTSVTFLVRIIGTDYLIIDIDPNSGSGDVIDNILISLGYAGFYTTSDAYLDFDSLSQYTTVWIFCGIYSNNARIETFQGTEIEQYLQSGGKLYIEGGDLWGFDPGLGYWNLLPWTGVASAQDGTGDLYTVQGVPNTQIPQVDGNSWSYNGENNWIDQLTPDPNPPHGGVAEGYLQNPDVGYYCGVAYNQGTWKTVGNTFELGTLTEVVDAPLDSLVSWIMGYLYMPPPDHDVGVTSILQPSGVLYLGDVVTPSVSVHNFGLMDETFDVAFKIFDSNNNEVYSSTYTGLFLASGNDTVIGFSPDFTASDTGSYTTLAYTMLSGDMNPLNDTSSGSFIIFDTTGFELPPPTFGPDNCGYVGSSSQDTVHPALQFQWIDPTAGTVLPLSDDSYTTVNLSFPFPFYGQTLTSLNVCSNGFIQWPTTSTSFSNQPLPYSSISNFIGNWDDYNPSSGGQVYFYDAGAFAVIAWVGVPHFGANVPNTFEIILYPSGVIKMQFMSMDPAYTNSSTLGIQKEVGADSCYLQYVYNGVPGNHIVEDSLVVMFWYQPLDHDVGVVAISPEGSIPPVTHDVEVVVRNYGQNDETFDLSTNIVDTVTGTTVFSATQTVSLTAMSTATFNMGQWTPDSNSYYALTAWVELPGDERPYNDTLTVYARTALGLGDVVFFTDVQAQTGNIRILGLEFDGEHFYVTAAGDNASPPHWVYELDMDGNYTGNSWQQPTTQNWGWRDLAYDGTNEWDTSGTMGHFYGSDDPMVDEWHIESGNLVVDGSFPGPESPNRALAYNPENDHFYTANFSGPLYEFDRSGSVIGTWGNTFAMYGAAYDPGPTNANTPYIWWSSQDPNQWGYNNLIHQWDINTQSFTGVQIHPPLPDGFNDQIAGGLCFWPDYNGMSVLFELVQGDPDDYIIGFYVRPASETRIPVSVEEQSTSEKLVFSLSNTLPNPVRNNAVIRFTIPEKGHTILRVYDATGRLVKTLVSKEMLPGRYSVTWNGTNNAGGKVASGVYFYRLDQGKNTAIRRMVYLR